MPDENACDPNAPDIEAVLAELDVLARKWAPRPRKPKAAPPS